MLESHLTENAYTTVLMKGPYSTVWQVIEKAWDAYLLDLGDLQSRTFPVHLSDAHTYPSIYPIHTY